MKSKGPGTFKGDKGSRRSSAARFYYGTPNSARFLELGGTAFQRPTTLHTASRTTGAQSTPHWRPENKQTTVKQPEGSLPSRALRSIRFSLTKARRFRGSLTPRSKGAAPVGPFFSPLPAGWSPGS